MKVKRISVIILVLIIFCCAFCSQSAKKNLPKRDELSDFNNIFMGNQMYLSSQMVGIPDKIRDAITPLNEKAQEAGNIALELIKNKSNQFSNKPPYKNLSRKELLDSLTSLEALQRSFRKKADLIEVAYNQKIIVK
jgi:hypothetical protein